LAEMAENPEKDVYEMLKELWRKEVESEGLAKLPDDLSQKLREYIGSIKHYLKVSDKETLSAEIKEAAANAVVRLVEDIFELRLRKILRYALNNQAPESLYNFEFEFYPSLLKLIQDYRESVREMATAVAYQDWAQIKSQYELVCFLKDVEQIIGSDLKVYGPFKAGDLAVLPPENARNLELANVIRIIRVLEPRL